MGVSNGLERRLLDLTPVGDSLAQPTSCAWHGSPHAQSRQRTSKRYLEYVKRLG